MKYYGRMLYRPETLQEFEHDDELTTADEYVHQFMRCDKCGVTFVEIATSLEGPWQIWRVELLVTLPVVLFTRRCDEPAARKELAENGYPL